MLKKVDLSEKIILITGASDGIGKEIALKLSQFNAGLIIMACRESEKAKNAHQQVCDNHPSSANNNNNNNNNNNKNVILEFIDLADLSNVKAFVDRLVLKNIQLDVLVNNAGIILSERKETKDGFEMQFGTNFLGHFLLTELILKHNILKENARVINLSSHAMLFGHLDFNDIHFERRPYSSWKAYTQSKLANVVYANYLDRKHAHIHVNSLHPGMVRTSFANNAGMFHVLDMMFYPIYYVLSKSPQDGAETTIYLASSPEVEGRGGLYWVNNQPFTLFKSKQSQNEKLQDQLYMYSKNLIEKYI